MNNYSKKYFLEMKEEYQNKYQNESDQMTIEFMSEIIKSLESNEQYDSNERDEIELIECIETNDNCEHYINKNNMLIYFLNKNNNKIYISNNELSYFKLLKSANLLNN